jgi:hypothetical protein
MPETTQPENWPSPRGPWPEIGNSSRIFDHGRYWCANAAGHPNPEGGYPNPAVHIPFDECRTLAASFADVRRNLSEQTYELDLYAAAAFQFGAARSSSTLYLPARMVLDFYSDTTSAEPGNAIRFSLPAGEALRLSRRITQVVDLVTVPPLHLREGER